MTVVGSAMTRSIGVPNGWFTPGPGFWLDTTHVEGIGSVPGGSLVTSPSVNPWSSIAVVAASSVEQT